MSSISRKNFRGFEKTDETIEVEVTEVKPQQTKEQSMSGNNGQLTKAQKEQIVIDQAEAAGIELNKTAIAEVLKTVGKGRIRSRRQKAEFIRGVAKEINRRIEQETEVMMHDIAVEIQQDTKASDERFIQQIDNSFRTLKEFAEASERKTNENFEDWRNTFGEEFFQDIFAD